MQIDDLWKALEADFEAGKTGASGWLLRLARPSAGFPLFVGLELASRRRAVLLRLDHDPVRPRRRFPSSKGLETLVVTIGDAYHLGAVLKEQRFRDVFTALTEDLVRRVSDENDPATKARAFLDQLARWQKFLSATTGGLSEESQRGLWGELYFLREHLVPSLGTAAVSGWKGGERAHQDFQFENIAVEVKTTMAKKPHVVRITSERQLDSSSWSALFLNVIALDVQENTGETLPAMVSSLRARLSTDSMAQEQFEDKLLVADYLDVHAARYAERGYIVRSVGFFLVGPQFPRLTEADMPPGVGDANYALSVAACESFRATAGEVITALIGKAANNRKRKNRG